jgi:D-amino-acid dehydrogenase
MTVRVCVIGAGIVGCATAYHLARQGFQVQLIDSRPEPGLQTSFANGAQLSYSYVAPLASPQTLRALPGIVLGRSDGVRFRLRADPRQWLWGLRFLAACSEAASRQGTRELLSLADASRQLLATWLDEEAWSVDFTRHGKLVLCDDAATLHLQQAQVQLQAAWGCRQEVLGAADCIAIEPALGLRRRPFVGGVWTATECVVDPFKLCRSLAQGVRQRGGQLWMNTDVERLVTRGDRFVALDTSRGHIEADVFVLAAGLASVPLAATAGIRLPLQAIKGYSLTLPFRSAQRPRVSVTDLAAKAVFAPLGEALRVAAMAEMGETTLQIPPARVRRMLADVEATYPGLCDATSPQPWAGLRPATPSSVPIVARWRQSNLLLNVGHGALGLTLAAGSAARMGELARQFGNDRPAHRSRSAVARHSP